MKELLIGPSEQVDTFICQESFRRVKKEKKNNTHATVVKRRHYYDNSLIFKVTKGAGLHTGHMGPPSCSSSTSSHMDRTNCVLRRPFSPIHRGLVEVL